MLQRKVYLSVGYYANNYFQVMHFEKQNQYKILWGAKPPKSTIMLTRGLCPTPPEIPPAYQKNKEAAFYYFDSPFVCGKTAVFDSVSFPSHTVSIATAVL